MAGVREEDDMVHAAAMQAPNALTVFRAIAGVFGAWLLLQSSLAGVEAVAARYGLASGAIFALAALTDGLDGWLARKMGAESAFGALIDPIADKILVGAYFIAYVLISGVDPWLTVPVLIIVGRDAIVTGLRLTRMEGALADPMPVTDEAKLKTAFQMLLIAAPFLFVIAGWRDVEQWFYVWVGGVWFAALMTLWTAWGYLRPARRNGA